MQTISQGHIGHKNTILRLEGTLNEKKDNDLVKKLCLKKETGKLALEREKLKAKKRETAVKENQEFAINNMQNTHKLHEAKKMMAFKLNRGRNMGREKEQ